jgi:hypothetical protein
VRELATVHGRRADLLRDEGSELERIVTDCAKLDGQLADLESRLAERGEEPFWLHFGADGSD